MVNTKVIIMLEITLVYSFLLLDGLASIRSSNHSVLSILTLKSRFSVLKEDITGCIKHHMM